MKGCKIVGNSLRVPDIEVKFRQAKFAKTLSLPLTAILVAFAAKCLAVDLTDIKHVVLFMQENRAFDHVSPVSEICGTSLTSTSTMEPWLVSVVSLLPMSSSTLQRISLPFSSRHFVSNFVVYSFKVFVNRKVNSGLSTMATSLLPFYINYLGGNWTAASQCVSGGSNSWLNNQLALNGDLNDQWAWDNTAMSWTHFKRQDLPSTLLLLRVGLWQICIRYAYLI